MSGETSNLLARVLKCIGVLALILAMSSAHSVSHAASGKSVALIIRGGTVIDGTGGPGRQADVAIDGDRIVAVGQKITLEAKKTIDASGLVVTPGFIDIHNHSVSALASRIDHVNASFLAQGVTSVVLGPDGEFSPSSIRKLLDSFSSHGIGTNAAFYVGHNGIRSEVLGAQQDRAPTPEELVRMEQLVRKGMEMGAVGLSTGLMYSPGLFSQTDEVVALAKQIAPFGGIYETHVRDPNKALLTSDWEAIEVAREAHVPLDLTHLTTPGEFNHGLMQSVIDIVQKAQREGVRIVADQYPYHAVATLQLWGVLNYPLELAAASPAELRSALKKPSELARIRQETMSGGSSGFSQYRASGPASILILSAPGLPKFEGKFITDVAAELRMDSFDAVVYLLLHCKENVVVSLGGFYEDDMRLLMRQPWVMVASDGVAGPAVASIDRFRSDHPRATGTFPRVLGQYVRQEHVLGLEQAVHKMTLMPAQFLNLSARGKIAPGYFADITVFDPARISDRSTWMDPHAYPVGLKYVLVNGRIALSDGKATGAAAGRFLRRGEVGEPFR